MENKDGLLRLADMTIEDLSPMMQHYAEMKKQAGDAFLFYRLGDFYEMFFDDAIEGAKILELVLTRRNFGNGLRAPTCGIPLHA